MWQNKRPQELEKRQLFILHSIKSDKRPRTQEETKINYKGCQCPARRHVALFRVSDLQR
jgi:hypothetical protein